MRKNKKRVQFLFIALASLGLGGCAKSAPTTIPNPIARCERLQKNLHQSWQAIEKSTRQLEALNASLDQLESEKAQGKSAQSIKNRFAALQDQYQKTISESLATENRVKAVVQADLKEIATLRSLFLTLKTDSREDSTENLRRNARVGLSQSEIDEALKDLDQSQTMADQLMQSLTE